MLIKVFNKSKDEKEFIINKNKKVIIPSKCISDEFNISKSAYDELSDSYKKHFTIYHIRDRKVNLYDLDDDFDLEEEKVEDITESVTKKVIEDNKKVKVKSENKSTKRGRPKKKVE